MVLSEALSEARVNQRRGVVSAAAEQWPTGFIRIFLPEVSSGRLSPHTSVGS